MKRFVIALMLSLICIFIVHVTLFDNAYTLDAISNAIFIVGIFMFFISLIIITDATKIFMIVGYSLKATFRRKNFPYKSYYDYVTERQREKMTPYAPQVFIISIGYIIISLVLAKIFLQSL